MQLDPSEQEPGRRGGIPGDAPGQDDPEPPSEYVGIPTPLDFAKAEARCIEGLLQLELGSELPWFIVFRRPQRSGAIILYHSQGHSSVAYTDDGLAVGSLLIEFCERLGLSPS